MIRIPSPTLPKEGDLAVLSRHPVAVTLLQPSPSVRRSISFQKVHATIVAGESLSGNFKPLLDVWMIFGRRTCWRYEGTEPSANKMGRKDLPLLPCAQILLTHTSWGFGKDVHTDISIDRAALWSVCLHVVNSGKVPSNGERRWHDRAVVWPTRRKWHYLLLCASGPSLSAAVQCLTSLMFMNRCLCTHACTCAFPCLRMYIFWAYTYMCLHTYVYICGLWRYLKLNVSKCNFPRAGFLACWAQNQVFGGCIRWCCSKQ